MALEDTALRLVEESETELGQTPRRIIIEPNGDIEVNVRVGLRDFSHPLVYFKSRVKDTDRGRKAKA